MSHSAENFRKGILLFLRKFLVSKNFMDEKFLGYPFNLGYRKILCIIGCITIFRRIFFCPTVPKNFVGIISKSQKIWGFEKFYA